MAARAPREAPCIRCGDCASVCPAGLQPLRLLQQVRAGQLAAAEQAGIMDCSQCGRCDRACPSTIGLQQNLHEAMTAISAQRTRQQVAMATRERVRARQQRLARDQQARAERHDRTLAQATSGDAVAAAIARAAARRAGRKAPDA